MRTHRRFTSLQWSRIERAVYRERLRLAWDFAVAVLERVPNVDELFDIVYVNPVHEYHAKTGVAAWCVTAIERATAKDEKTYGVPPAEEGE